MGYKGKCEKFIKDTKNNKINQLKIKLNNYKFKGFNFFNNVHFFAKNKYINRYLFLRKFIRLSHFKNGLIAYLKLKFRLYS